MATKRGLCPYCTEHRVDRRIFPVNPEASTCFCPLCMKEVEPKIAIDGYRELIDKMLLKADNSLFVTCDPTLAYAEYAEVIELEPKEAHALLGRILCLIYMGKVRKSYLPEALALLENTSFEGCDIDEFVFFLKKINFALDEYESSICKKLTFKSYFYDVDCLKLYWIHLHETIKMKELILSIVKDIKKDYKSQQVDMMINLLAHNIDEKSKVLHLDTYIASGKSYRFMKVLYGKAVIEEGNKRVETHLLRYRLSTLDENEKHKRYIKDEVFKDYTKTVHATKITLALAIFFYLLMAGGVVTTVIFRSNTMLFFIFLGVSIFCFVLGTVLLSLHIAWKTILKKRKLRID